MAAPTDWNSGSASHDDIELRNSCGDDDSAQEGATLLTRHKSDADEQSGRRDDTSQRALSKRNWLSGPQTPRKQAIQPFLPGL